MSEARIDRLEADMRDVNVRLRSIEAAVTRIEATLNAVLPHLATKAELTDLRNDTSAGLGSLRSEMTTGFAELRVEIARMPSKLYLITAIGVLFAGQATALAALALLPVMTKLLQ